MELRGIDKEVGVGRKKVVMVWLVDSERPMDGNWKSQV